MLADLPLDLSKLFFPDSTERTSAHWQI